MDTLMGPRREDRATVRLRGGRPSFAPKWSQDRSSGASVALARLVPTSARAWAAAPGEARSWGAECRKPGRCAANSGNSEARGELIHRVLFLTPTRADLRSASAEGKFEAEARLSSGRQQQESGGGR